jgi:actin-related protein
MSSVSDDVRTIVLDMGSSMTRIGIAGDDAPQAVIPSIRGTAKNRRAMVGLGGRTSYVGDEAQSKRGVLALKHPIKNGIINNYDEWEQLLNHCITNELRLTPEEHPILFSVPLFNPHACESKQAQIMFETFQFPSIMGALAPALSLYASGRTSGTVVQSGDGVLQIMCFDTYQILEQGAVRRDFGGRSMTKYTTRMMRESSQPGTSNFDASSQAFDMEQLKEKICTVSKKYDEEMISLARTNTSNFIHVFDDGNEIGFSGTQRIRIGETMFKPALLGIESQGIHHLTNEAIMRCAMDSRPDLRNNIVLAGGVTMATGFSDRFAQEMKSLSPSTARVSVCSPAERKYLTWIGGSIIGSMDVKCWLSKADYDEYGPFAIHRHGIMTQSFTDRVYPK